MYRTGDLTWGAKTAELPRFESELAACVVVARIVDIVKYIPSNASLK